MNSYPHEVLSTAYITDIQFLDHPQPLMFIAGLSESSPSKQNQQRDRSSSILSTTSSRRPSHGASSLDPSIHAGALSLTSPLTSPGPSSASLPQSPPVEELAESDLIEGGKSDERDREFQGLLENLKGALAPKGEKSKVWIPSSERKDFRILLVDKVRLNSPQSEATLTIERQATTS